MTIASTGGTVTLGLYDTQSQLKEKASITYVDNKVDPLQAGHKGYATLAQAQAAQSGLAANTVVEVLSDTTEANNGYYLWNGTTLTKTTFSPLVQANNYTDSKVATAKAEAISTAASDATTKANNAVTTANNYTDSVFADVPTTLEPYVTQAEAAATAANIAGKVYATPSEGVAPVTGVPSGQYFNVRSSSNDNYIDEYFNNAGLAQATGKSYPSSDYLNNLPHDNLKNRDMAGAHPASAIADESGKTQQEINDSIAMSLLFENFGVSSSTELKEYIGNQAIQAIIKTNGADETATLRAYLIAAKTLKRPLSLPSGVIVFSDTIEIDFKAVISGFGRESTYLQFKNTTIGKPALRFKSGAGRGWYSDFTLRDETLFQSTGIEFTDSRSENNGPVWKNTFANIEILGFKESHTYTSANPLAGSTHAHCSENLWIQCRFSANQVTCVNRNCQAVNNVYLRCDFENSDTAYYNGQTITDANFEFFRDEAGGGITLINPSIIGRGRWFGWKYPTGGTTLFGGSGQFKAENVRAEVRTTHYGCLIEELVHGITGSLDMAIEVNTASCVVFDANIDLMRFGGRVNASFNNVFPAYGAGKLFVRCYPTQGRSSNINTGAQSTIVLDNCGTVFYERETSSPYGTYSRNATPSVVFRNQHSASTNSSYSIDSDGWMSLRYSGDIQQLPQSFGTAQAFSKLIYNLDWVSSGIGANSQIKVCMPKHGRPLKLFAYKHAVRLADNLTFNLYLVKDKANWATAGTFNLATDAIKVSELGSTLNKAGYFEVPVNLLSAALGNETMSGFSSWLEGRMLIEYVGSVAFAGFVGLDYV